jgi:hypothetical protein
VSNNSSIVACVFVATLTFLLSLCLAKIEGYTYAVEMRSGAMIYIPRFIKIGSGVQKLIGRIHRHTDRMLIS